MGHQIAMLCALGGYETTLHDIQEQALQRAKALLENMMNRWAKKEKMLKMRNRRIADEQNKMH